MIPVGRDAPQISKYIIELLMNFLIRKQMESFIYFNKLHKFLPSQIDDYVLVVSTLELFLLDIKSV